MRANKLPHRRPTHDAPKPARPEPWRGHLRDCVRRSGFLTKLGLCSPGGHAAVFQSRRNPHTTPKKLKCAYERSRARLAIEGIFFRSLVAGVDSAIIPSYQAPIPTHCLQSVASDPDGRSRNRMNGFRSLPYIRAVPESQDLAILGPLPHPHPAPTPPPPPPPHPSPPPSRH